MGLDDLRDAVRDKLLASWRDRSPDATDRLVDEIVKLCEEKFRHDLREWGDNHG